MRPRRHCGKFIRGPTGKSPAQPFDQTVESLPILFFDTRHAPEAAGGIDVAVGFRSGDRLLIFIDSVVDETATLSEQTHEVVGLAMIRRIRHRCDGIDVIGGPDRAAVGGGASAGHER